MVDIENFKEAIEKQIGEIQSLTPIEKGFSIEKKFKMQINCNDYLLRLSPIKSLLNKTEEFELMLKLYQIGVQCNKPLIMLKDEKKEMVCSVYSYLSGVDAEDNIFKVAPEFQYEIGFAAGEDLKKINSLSRETNNWKERKWKKHQYYLDRYFKQDYRFKNDKKVLHFIETYYDKTEADKDYLQHDDFHLGNILIRGFEYGGIIDFNRFDWGDPLHEFVKLEWFTFPVSEMFAQGQVDGYFGKQKIDDAQCRQISVYIAMSIFSTIVWTLQFHRHTFKNIELKIISILDHFDCFESIRPKWLI